MFKADYKGVITLVSKDPLGPSLGNPNLYKPSLFVPSTNVYLIIRVIILKLLFFVFAIFYDLSLFYLVFYPC